MDEFLERYKPLKLIQEEIENLSRLVASKEIELVKKIFKKSKGPNGFTGNCTKHLKERLTPIFTNIYKKMEEIVILPNSFCDASITAISKQDKDLTRKTKTTGAPRWLS